MTAEPMKCANCGESIVQMMSRHWKHEFTGFQDCRLYAKPMEGITGIKSEDIKPVERQPLPTSREWLESDGECFDWQDGDCGARTSPPYSCNVLGTHHRHVAATSSGRVIGRWYTGGPFVEAKS